MRTPSARHVVVEPGESDVVAHIGLDAPCTVAGRLGLSAVLSSRIPTHDERTPLHDLGNVLVQAMAMLAGGGVRPARQARSIRGPSIV